MKPINKLLVFSSIILLSVTSVAATRDNPEKRVVKTETFKDISIKEVEIWSKGTLLVKEIVLEKKLIESHAKKERRPTKNKKVDSTPKIDNVLWTITAEQLPVTQSMCEKVDSLTCNEIADNAYGKFCTNRCIMYGPQFVVFDEQNGKLYLSAKTVSGGNAGWPLLGFVADIKSHKIEPFNQLYGPAEIALSPSGENLALVTNYSIHIINTQNRKETYFQNSTIKKENNHYYAASKLKWSNDTELSYVIEDYQEKFEPRSSIQQFEQIFDIKTQKIVHSKTLVNQPQKP